MNKNLKKRFATAAILMILGAVLFVAVMTAFDWDFTRLSTVTYEASAHEVQDSFRHISIITEGADIVLLPSEDGKCRVICFEQANAKHTVAVQEDRLSIDMKDEREWYEYVGIHFNRSKIAVHLPMGAYGSLSILSSTGNVEIPGDFTFERVTIEESTGDVICCASVSEAIRIKTTTGDIRVENVSAGTIDLSVSTGGIIASKIVSGGEMKTYVSTGRVSMEDIRCETFLSDGSTGDIFLKHVIAGEMLSVERSTGDVQLESCDAAEIFIKTGTGDVTGSLLSDKIFITKSSTGYVDVPGSTTGGKCEIRTATGDIRIRLAADESFGN